MKTHTLFIVDDHRIFSDGLKRTIESRNDYQVLRCFDRAEALLEALHFEQPDLIISDISMPGMNGIDMAKQIRAQFPLVKVLILSMHIGPTYVKPALEAGVHGYLLKDSRADEVFDAIQAVLEGQTYVAPKIAAALLQHKDNDMELTPRELEVLVALAKGLNTKEIGDALFISSHTVETHRKNILTKSGCKNVAQLISWGYAEGLIAK